MINKIPLQSIDNDTPYFRLFQSSTDFTNLKAFDCLCFVFILPVHRTKFDAKASPCVFISYSVSHKGYKVLDLHTDKIFISRDVKFHEMHFSFHLDKKDDSSNFPTSVYLTSVTSILKDDYSSANRILIANDQYMSSSSFHIDGNSLGHTSIDHQNTSQILISLKIFNLFLQFLSENP